MKPKKLLMNQSGISLMEVLVASVVMSILSVGIMQMMNDQVKTSKTGQIAFDINEIYSRIQRQMIDGQTCFESLQVGPIPENGEVAINEIKKAGHIYFTSVAPDHVIGELKIDSMKLKRKSGLQQSDIDLEVVLKKTNSNKSYGSESIIRTITLQGKFDASHVIVSCYSALDGAVSTAREESCKDLCPTCWDNVTKTCNLRNKRPIYFNTETGNLSYRKPPAYITFTQHEENCGGDANINCPAGSWAVSDVRRSRNSGAGDGCGLNRRYYADLDCRKENGIDNSAVPAGYLIPDSL